MKKKCMKTEDNVSEFLKWTKEMTNKLIHYILRPSKLWKSFMLFILYNNVWSRTLPFAKYLSLF